jgi:hypothetical protein
MNPARIPREPVGKLERLTALLASHRATCEQVIALSEANQGHGARSTILGALARRAKGYIAGIDRTLRNPSVSGTHSDLGAWGHNGRGPAIDDLLRSARFHAAAYDWRAEIGKGPAVSAPVRKMEEAA